MRDISLHLMDIMQNSISAKAGKITVILALNESLDELEVAIIDNGMGMDEEFLKNVTDPFVTTRTTRKVGLGIPLLKASAQRAGGELAISSEKNKGTEIKAFFKVKHIDRIPLGDIAETMVSTIISDPGIGIELIMSDSKESFTFNSYEVKEKLGDVPITNYEVITWMKEYIDEGLKRIFGGVLDEITS
jgi:hypothetical protein